METPPLLFILIQTRMIDCHDTNGYQNIHMYLYLIIKYVLKYWKFYKITIECIYLIHVFMWDIIIHPWPNGCVIKSSLTLGQWLFIASIDVVTHPCLISMLVWLLLSVKGRGDVLWTVKEHLIDSTLPSHIDYNVLVPRVSPKRCQSLGKGPSD